jgi:hypothetical protein
MAERKGTGRGWKGDRAGHQRAGRLGGLARRRNRGNSSESSSQSE